MEKIHNWGGAFLPLRKHRDYCGVIANHLVILSITPLDDEDEIVFDFDDDAEINLDAMDADELIKFGTGDIPYLVRMTWRHEGHGTEMPEYNYIMMAERQPTKEEVVGALAKYIEEENAHRRREGQREITDGSDPFAD